MEEGNMSADLYSGVEKICVYDEEKRLAREWYFYK
jgi:hypothetical protein